MNNIYKVIWSKAKNCYVVASEIARSHTKSASGSEKIGGGTRRKLLASLMALSLLCGGLGVASAVDYVHVEESPTSTTEVYTAAKVDTLLNDKADRTELGNKANAADVALNTEKIATNKAAIEELKNNKLDKDLANNTLATKNELRDLKDTVDDKANTDLSNLTADGVNKIKNTMKADMDLKANKVEVNAALDGKADKSTVTDLATKVGDASSGLVNDVATLKTKVGDDTNGLVKDVAELKNQGTTLNAALGDKADKADLNNATNRIAVNEGEITALKNKTGQLSADGKELKDMTTVSGTTVSGTNVEAGALKVTGVISNDLGVTTTLTDINNSMKQTGTNKDDIDTLKTTTNDQQTAINKLNEKTTKITYDAALGTKVDGVTFNAGKVTGVTSINGIDIGDAQVDMNEKNLTGVGTINGTKIGTNTDGEYIRQDNSIWGNMKIVDTQVKTNAEAIAQEKTDREKAIGSLTGDKNYIKKANNVSDNLVELDKQAKTNADAIAQEKTDRENAIGSLTEDKNYIKKDKNVSDNLVELDKQAKTNADAIAQEKTDRENAIGSLTEDKNYIKKDKNVSDNLVELDKQAKTNADAITETNQRTAGITRDDTRKETSIEGKVTVDTNGNIKAEGTITSNGLDARAGEIKTTGKVSAGDVSTGTLETTGKATIGGDLTVDGKLNVDKISMKNDELKNGKRHDSATTITADEISNLAKVTEQGNTTESQFTHNEKGTFNYAKDEKSTGEWKRATSNVTADGVSNQMTDSDKNRHTYYQTATETREQLVNGDKSKSNFEKKTAEGNTISITEKDAAGNPKSSLTNTQTVAGEKTSVTNKDSSSTIKQGADQIRYNVTSKDENKTSSSIEVKADGITNTSKDGTIINDAKDIENNATGDITNTAQNGSIINKADNGNISNTAQNVTNEGTKSVTNKVGANEVKVSTDGVDITVAAGKKITESVGTASRVVENDKITDKAGDSTVTTENGKGTTFGKVGSAGTTNIYGNSIKTGTINANDTTTDKLTAGAAAGADGGRLTVDANDGVKGSYKYGDYTSKSYILPNTLQSGVDNGKKPTDADFVGSRTDHYMEGNKAKLDETVKDAAGSNVTNKTSTDTVTTITDGTTTTTTEQGVKDITNTATGGTITNTAKDIVNNAQDTITNTAGTKITDTAGDSSVVTENGKGTTFTKTGSTAYSTAAGAPTDTNIAGNHITTGRVDANELGVSDKDGDNTADFSVKAGEGVKASAGDGKTTGSLDVTAGEVGSSVKDASGKGSTFKQRIDAIMGNVKTDAGESDVTQKGDEITSKVGIGEATNSKVTQKKDLLETAVTDGTNYNISDDTASASAKLLTDGTKVNKQQDNLDSSVKTITNGTYTTSTVQSALDITHTAKDGTITNDAKDIVNNASNSITDKVGDNTRVTTSTSITDTVGTANRKIEDGKITDTAGDSTVTTVHGKGTTFTKKGSTAYREGGPTDTNISGNTITTGKVTMDYADVMKDLGVRGNANINGKTTTGSLEVTGTSTLKGDVTMESNAIVKKNLTVEGTTTTKTLKVTEDAEVGRNLTVGGNATITGDVTAKSYKVGDKTYISADGINANDQKITNVADGSISEGSKDAVNGGQLYGMKTDLEHKVDKVGANAAAMANLHPMEFDPDSKWNIAAAMGNYGSETATAIGAFYRPNEDVMVNFSTAFGTGENMVGGGVSVRLGKGSNKLSREESNALKAQVNDLTARMDALLSVLNPNMSKDFPDVPENHWAYEAVSRLAGNDIVQGYPDGEFHGDRTMTRYEMAEIIYNALSRGAEAERELVEEFKPELQAMAASEKATAERAEG